MRVLFMAMLFSTLQATMQARQSMQRAASKRKALCSIVSVICHLCLLHRYKGLAERLAAADRVGVGHMQERVAPADAEGRRQPLGEMTIPGGHVDTIRADGFGGMQQDVDLAHIALGLHPVA